MSELLAKPIRLDLKLNGWQIGAITGLSFCASVHNCCLALARIAERLIDRHRALIRAESVGLIGAILFLIARPIYIREAKY